jgi:hypothetical protein
MGSAWQIDASTLTERALHLRLNRIMLLRLVNSAPRTLRFALRRNVVTATQPRRNTLPLPH